ncbi:alpha-hydroxy acid oxidase [Achromobacter xylosoxidans]|uniref:alpha-hydroxy acid oxidase n=2 Tax=Alcaligenes xylosoxydans xylosoxydans TaxID=85698 RepID=UPI0006AC59E6|nr:alpha-hydroxy acid oxidase [Achromobacter xylosoxidans]KOQ18075.1 L-lactate cytochrome reductase [Achromobacter xylosoxidans]KOQ18784.1 L-lactate cytochrome reductase [Achromobacter xylosoxidans]KOQ21033.1 L-lactate cytochrome reductase [Achromobacter xylosoxidans]KOQ37156.1 L-lactate cytochrome reductase [Achromobacter xylosoxidans]KOQ38623.1 L-lactate cytochrome reductase [Achromobacter xylosoxidans]
MTARLDDCYSIERLRLAARVRLPRPVFDFFDGGAEDEITLRENAGAFQRLRLAPRVLRDVSRVDATAMLVGAPAALPCAIAPTGAVGFGWRGGDVALARAAAQAGIPYTLSTSATASIEEIADRAPGRLWFQAYILQDKARLADLIRRAGAAGYEALMITVDLPVGGKRERDLAHGLAFPMKINLRNFFQFARKPAWSLDMLLRRPPAMPSLAGLARVATDRKAMKSVAGRNYDPAFKLDDLARLREDWQGKLIVKGVVNALDVDAIVAIGADALVVSNHGGRQLDTGIATLAALPEVIAAARGRVPVLLDGGVRRGSDIFKALALGAAGVLTGRATLYGVLAGGHPGACKALEILRDELARTMQLCGADTLAAIDETMLRMTSP